MNLKKIFDGKGNEHSLDSKKIGNLGELTTNAKDSLVTAVNEVDGRVPKVAPETNEGLFLRVVNGALALQELTDVSKNTEITDYVIMPGKDYQDACNAIREKTGETDEIKSGEMASEIHKIPTEIVDVNLQTISISPSVDKQVLVPEEGYDGFSKILVGKVDLEPLTVTPSSEWQWHVREGTSTNEDDPLCGFSEVTVEPIPDQYKDVSVVTATAPHVLEGDVFVDADGNPVEGTMKNKGSVLKNLRYSGYAETYTYTIPEGYHDGTGKVKAVCEAKSVTPSKSEQTVRGKPYEDKTTYGATFYDFLGKVTVEPIPDQYQDVTPVTATAEDVRAGKVIVDAEGNVVEGTAPNTIIEEWTFVLDSGETLTKQIAVEVTEE